jgi:hypothetical protein
VRNESIAKFIITESRDFKRLPMHAAVVFFWSDSAGAWQQGEGVTRDISTGGMFVWTDSLPQAGARIVVSVLLPRLDVTPVRMQVEGLVRHVRELECAGFGLHSDEVVLVDDLTHWCDLPRQEA